MSNPIYILIVLFLLILILLYLTKVSNAFEFYIKEKYKENKTEEKSLNDGISKLKNQIKFYRIKLKQT